jgi:hypothetical protein
MTERWLGKVGLLGIGALVFFIIGLVVLTRPAPKLKIDALLTILNVRLVVRRLRRRVLRRMVAHDHAIPDNGINDEVHARCVQLLDENKIHSMVEFRRAAASARAAGLVAAPVSASVGGTGAGAIATMVAAAAGNLGDQVLHTGEERVTDALNEAIGSPDVDGSMEVSGVRRNSLVFDGLGTGARALVGDGNSAQSCFSNFVAQVRGVVAVIAPLLISPGQLKLVLGNLQINASLTVVFSIPWPPVHVRFINFLSVFKLDLFKGLSFAAPCLHASHFMSLASFVAAVRTELAFPLVVCVRVIFPSF